jgi:hypothetical protein
MGLEIPKATKAQGVFVSTRAEAAQKVIAAAEELWTAKIIPGGKVAGDGQKPGRTGQFEYEDPDHSVAGSEWLQFGSIGESYGKGA